MRTPAARLNALRPARFAALLSAGLTLALAPAPAPGPAWAEAAPPPASAVVPAEVEADGVTVRIHPNQVRIDRSRRFDAQGRTQQLNNQLSIHFQAAVTSERTVLAYRSHGVERLRDGWDRELTMPNPASKRNDPWTVLRPNRHGRGNADAPAAQFSFGFNTQAPDAEVQVLSAIDGRIELKVADGELRAIRLAPLGEFLGKRLRIRDMDDLQIMVERTLERGEQGVSLSLAAERMAQVRAVRFVSAQGRELPGGDSGRQRRQGAIESRVYRDAPGDDATMEVHVYPEVAVIKVPWTVRDVPLPGAADAGPAEELALNTQPLVGGPRLPGLDVEVQE